MPISQFYIDDTVCGIRRGCSLEMLAFVGKETLDPDGARRAVHCHIRYA